MATAPCSTAQLGRAAQRHVLANGGDRIGERVRHRSCRSRDWAPRTLSPCHRCQRDLGDIGDDFLERGVAGNEIGFRIDLDDNRLAQAGIDTDQSLGGRAISLLVGLRNALLAQPVDSLFHVAVGLGQRLLAIHHACACLFAQFFHLCSRNAHRCLFVSKRIGAPSVDDAPAS